MLSLITISDLLKLDPVLFTFQAAANCLREGRIVEEFEDCLAAYRHQLGASELVADIDALNGAFKSEPFVALQNHLMTTFCNKVSAENLSTESPAVRGRMICYLMASIPFPELLWKYTEAGCSIWGTAALSQAQWKKTISRKSRGDLAHVQECSPTSSAAGGPRSVGSSHAISRREAMDLAVFKKPKKLKSGGQDHMDLAVDKKPLKSPLSGKALRKASVKVADEAVDQRHRLRKTSEPSDSGSLESIFVNDSDDDEDYTLHLDKENSPYVKTLLKEAQSCVVRLLKADAYTVQPSNLQKLKMIGAAPTLGSMMVPEGTSHNTRARITDPWGVEHNLSFNLILDQGGIQGWLLRTHIYMAFARSMAEITPPQEPALSCGSPLATAGSTSVRSPARSFRELMHPTQLVLWVCSDKDKDREKRDDDEDSIADSTPVHLGPDTVIEGRFIQRPQRLLKQLEDRSLDSISTPTGPTNRLILPFNRLAELHTKRKSSMTPPPSAAETHPSITRPYADACILVDLQNGLGTPGCPTTLLVFPMVATMASPTFPVVESTGPYVGTSASVVSVEVVRHGISMSVEPDIKLHAGMASAIEVHITPPQSGLYTVSVTVDKEHISGSPLIISAKEIAPPALAYLRRHPSSYLFVADTVFSWCKQYVKTRGAAASAAGQLLITRGLKVVADPTRPKQKVVPQFTEREGDSVGFMLTDGMVGTLTVLVSSHNPIVRMLVERIMMLLCSCRELINYYFCLNREPFVLAVAANSDLMRMAEVQAAVLPALLALSPSQQYHLLESTRFFLLEEKISASPRMTALILDLLVSVLTQAQYLKDMVNTTVVEFLTACLEDNYPLHKGAALRAFALLSEEPLLGSKIKSRHLALLLGFLANANIATVEHALQTLVNLAETDLSGKLAEHLVTLDLHDHLTPLLECIVIPMNWQADRSAPSPSSTECVSLLMRLLACAMSVYKELKEPLRPNAERLHAALAFVCDCSFTAHVKTRLLAMLVLRLVANLVRAGVIAVLDTDMPFLAISDELDDMVHNLDIAVITGMLHMQSSSPLAIRRVIISLLTPAMQDPAISELITSERPGVFLREVMQLIDEGVEMPYYNDIPPSRIKKDTSRTIGSGAAGQIYRSTLDGQQVAVKCFEPDGMGFNLTEFKREVLATSILRHTNVLSCIGAHIDMRSKEVYIVFPYCEKGSLYDLIHSKKDVEISNATKCRIALEAALGIAFLHSQGLIHRDVKPGNLLIADDDRIQIIDFGSSKVKADMKCMTLNIGTPSYMAPEVYHSAKTYSYLADVFSFGMMLWELWERRLPFDNLNNIRMLKAIYVDNQRPEFSPSCPYADLVSRCWALAPGDRPAFDVIVSELLQLVPTKTPGRYPKRRGEDLSASLVAALPANTSATQANPTHLCKSKDEVGSAGFVDISASRSSEMVNVTVARGFPSKDVAKKERQDRGLSFQSTTPGSSRTSAKQAGAALLRAKRPGRTSLSSSGSSAVERSRSSGATAERVEALLQQSSSDDVLSTM